MYSVSFQFLGRPSVSVNGRPVNISRHKTIALIAYLAVTGVPHSREKIADLFWPDLDEKRARANLRTVLSDCHHFLPEDILEVEGDSLRIACGPRVQCDILTFMDLTNAKTQAEKRDTERLAKAARLYRGEFLQGLSLPDCPGFEDWKFDTAQFLLTGYSKVLERLHFAAREQGDTNTAIDSARRILATDPLREDMHRALMETLADSGDTRAALRQFEILRRILRREDEGEPEAETSELAAELLRPGKRARPGGLQASSPAGRKPYILIASVAVLLSAAALSLLMIERNRGPSADSPVSIAVLPFNFLCLAEDDERNAESFTIEMTTALAKEPFFSVIPHVSVKKYAKSILTVPEIAEELGVRYILDGATQADAKRLRFSVQLIDARLNECLWAEMYECEMNNTLATQKEVVDFIKNKVQQELRKE